MRPRFHRLIDRAWPRMVVIPLALAGLVVLITLFTQPTERDDDRVRSVLSDYVDAVGNRDGIDACKLLTAHAQALITAGVPGTPCATYIHSFGADAGGLVQAKISLARDLGDRVSLNSGNMTAPNGTPVKRTVELVRSGGGYLIDSIGY